MLDIDLLGTKAEVENHPTTDAKLLSCHAIHYMTHSANPNDILADEAYCSPFRTTMERVSSSLVSTFVNLFHSWCPEGFLSSHWFILL